MLISSLIISLLFVFILYNHELTLVPAPFRVEVRHSVPQNAKEADGEVGLAADHPRLLPSPLPQLRCTTRFLYMNGSFISTSDPHMHFYVL